MERRYGPVQGFKFMNMMWVLVIHVIELLCHTDDIVRSGVGFSQDYYLPICCTLYGGQLYITVFGAVQWGSTWARGKDKDTRLRFDTEPF